MSLETIVIAALVIIVLVVLILILTGNLGGFSSGVSECQTRRGECKTSCDIMEPRLDTEDCKKENKLCCIKLS